MHESEGLLGHMWQRGKFAEGKGVDREVALAPLFRIYVPDQDGLREQLTQVVHRELGHAGRYRTYQGLQSKFVWPGMCSATHAHANHCTCTLCQLHAPKAPAAPIQGHDIVQADECAQVVTADIVHMPDANGNTYMLTVMDTCIFSRYGDAVPLTAITALEVTIALRDVVLPNGWGRPEMWVLDGGSEFKAELAEALEAWGADWRESAPEHPESHGAIERYNRTLCNKIAKLMDEQKTENSTEVRAAAVEATR